ncbi:hypothetical protein PUN28_002770 [Cardiocondyla obscurior]|uniref:Uncharacterized protein n=1 Tax=Cardiocondyla obscurior TaxID=286306 RepID=A0AAW2GW81_9HYME
MLKKDNIYLFAESWPGCRSAPVRKRGRGCRRIYVRLKEPSRESCPEARRSAFPIDEFPSGEDCCLRTRRKLAVIRPS